MKLLSVELTTDISFDDRDIIKVIITNETLGSMLVSEITKEDYKKLLLAIANNKLQIKFDDKDFVIIAEGKQDEANSTKVS